MNLFQEISLTSPQICGTPPDDSSTENYSSDNPNNMSKLSAEVRKNLHALVTESIFVPIISTELLVYLTYNILSNSDLIFLGSTIR